ncbi:MAG: response regulator transcription factor [Verrucomicrobiota bacterium]|nr:response regulator transcription factor [Verrucomicrobiota bacterium]
MKRIRTLIVDDNACFRNAAVEFLTRFEQISIIAEAEDGPAAVRMSEELTPELVLMDISIPHLNGLQATRKIKQQQNAPKIILLTLHSSEAYRLVAKDVGADHYVLKTELANKLVPAIDQLFGI